MSFVILLSSTTCLDRCMANAEMSISFVRSGKTVPANSFMTYDPFEAHLTAFCEGWALSFLVASGGVWCSVVCGCE